MDRSDSQANDETRADGTDSATDVGSTDGPVEVSAGQDSFQTAVAGGKGQSETSAFRMDNLRSYGKGSLAYSSLQEGMQYFMHALGYLAYSQLDDSKDSVVVLADPICAPENLERFLSDFIESKRDPIFLHVSHATAQTLSNMGFTINELGVETIIDIPTFDLVGNKKQQLRNARNGARKDGIVIEELQSLTSSELEGLRKISEEWLKDKVTSDSEMHLIVRPLVYEEETDVRRFVARLNGEIVGFVVFDPMYEGGKVIGYIANHLRTNLRRSYSIVDAIILEAMEKFKAEGKTELSLGLSPLAKVDDKEFKYSKLLQANFRYAYENANFLYNFKNLAQHKMKYRPGSPGAREEKVYCAMRTSFMLVKLPSVYKLLGLRPLSQALSDHAGQMFKGWIASSFTRAQLSQAGERDGQYIRDGLSVTLGDGRQLGYAEYGDPDGQPLLYFHGGMSCRLDIAFAARRCKERKVRLIAPDRPGLGLSSRKPDRDLPSWADDVEQFLSLLSLSGIPLLGWSLGSAYVFPCLYRLPALFTKAATVGTCGSMDSPDYVAEFALSMDRLLVGTSESYRWLLAAYISTFALAPKPLLQQIAEHEVAYSPADRTVVRTLGSQTTDFLLGSVKQGPDGIIDDYWAVRDPWNFPAEDITVPLTMFHGEEDKMAPLSGAQQVKSMIRGSTLHMVPKSGHFLLHDHLDAVLDSLLN